MKIIKILLVWLILFHKLYANVDTLGIKEILIKPSKTDTNIKMWDEPHQILYRENSQPNHLILFFQGSYGKPGGFKLFKATILNHENMIIDLRYPNDWLTFQKCQSVLDERIFDKFRYEIFTGGNYHPTIKVDTSNSLLNRFKKLIEFLKENENSKISFLFKDDGEIDYYKITVAGFSQGAGMALLFGGKYPVDRIVLVSGPVDSNIVLKKVASWITDSINLRQKQIYGFVNYKDYYYNYIKNCWYKIGMKSYNIFDTTYLGNKEIVNDNRFNFTISKIKHKDGHNALLLDENYELYNEVWRHMFKKSLIINKK